MKCDTLSFAVDLAAAAENEQRPGGQQGGGGGLGDREFHDPGVVEVGDIDIPRAVQGDTGRDAKLPAPGPGTAEGGEGAREVRRIETVDPVVDFVNDIDIPRAVHGNAERLPELPAAGSDTAEGGEGAGEVRRI